MAQDSVLKALGLVTQFSPLSVAQGGLVRANNAIISRDNSLENRRGYMSYGSLSAQPSQLFTYSNRVIVQSGTSISYDNGSGTFSAYSGSYSPPTGYRMQTELAKSNLYVTTSTGVKVFSDVAGTVARTAGAPRALNPIAALNAAGTGFLPTSTQCAYRVLIQRTDNNSNVITGYPSQRLWVPNIAGTAKNVDLDCFIPSECVAGDAIQVYRTKQFSGTASDGAGDEMYLAYQATITSAQVTAGKVSITDSITDALLGATLYTSPSQEGISQGNAQPPLAKSLSLFKGFMFYSNTTTKHRLYFTLVGVTGLSTKTVVINGVTYTFSTASENTATGQVLVGSTGVTAFDIDTTARSLVNVINRYTSNTSLYAYYLSGPTDPPGKIMVEERGVGGSSYSVAPDASIAVNFSYTSATSSNEVSKNRSYYSKPDQPEAVPLLNYVPIGPANAEILKTVALRDSLIFITDSGVYRLTGETPSSFSVVPLDLTVICRAKDSIATLANEVFMLSNQGVVTVTDAGVQTISREIEDQIKPLLSLSAVSTLTFGLSYESDRMYILSCPQVSTDTAPTQSFVYNIFTRAWTRWTFGIVAGVVEGRADKLYFAKTSASQVYVERKSFSDSDYADPETAITITAVSGQLVTFTSSGASPLAGWAIKVGTTSIVISSMASVGTTYRATMLYTPPASWVPGAATIYPPVGFDIEWNAWHGQQPALLKRVQQYEILCDQLTGQHSATQLQASFKSDIDGNLDLVPIDSSFSKFGLSPWGEFPWGGQDDNYDNRTWPPANKVYCRLLSVGVQHANAFEKVAICGYALIYDIVSERTSK